MKKIFVGYLAVPLLIIIAACLNLINAQGSIPPLTRDELIDMCQRPIFQQNPQRVINDFIRINKITFLPTKATVKYLNDNGVPKIITDELKYNFASHIVFRICEFEPADSTSLRFTKTLNTIMEQQRMSLKEENGLLKDKTFEPVPAGSKGPARQELLDNPHSGYVLIMGDIENQQGSQKKLVTVRLAFISRMQALMSIAPPIKISMNNTPSSREAVAKQIVRWSIKEVEDQIK
jgi:hypothetical protein